MNNLDINSISIQNGTIANAPSNGTDIANKDYADSLIMSGPTGPQGNDGSNGANGPQGSTGSTGSNGSNGSNGTQGSTGSSGSNGAQGTFGTNGTQGAAGSTGVQGVQGSSGGGGLSSQLVVLGSDYSLTSSHAAVTGFASSALVSAATYTLEMNLIITPFANSDSFEYKSDGGSLTCSYITISNTSGFGATASFQQLTNVAADYLLANSSGGSQNLIIFANGYLVPSNTGTFQITAESFSGTGAIKKGSWFRLTRIT